MLLSYWARLYQNMTKAECALEPAVAAIGRPYRVQHPFFGLKHFADFALVNDKVIIEVDGESHSTPAQKKKDLEHTIALKALGWEVKRVTNDQALSDPHNTVRAALSQPANSLEDLQARLGQLLLDYPELLVKKARRSRSRKPRRATKARANRRPNNRKKGI